MKPPLRACMQTIDINWPSLARARAETPTHLALFTTRLLPGSEFSLKKVFKKLQPWKLQPSMSASEHGTVHIQKIVFSSNGAAGKMHKVLELPQPWTKIWRKYWLLDFQISPKGPHLSQTYHRPACVVQFGNSRCMRHTLTATHNTPRSCQNAIEMMVKHPWCKFGYVTLLLYM